MHTLAQAFPHIAAKIDAERVLLARPIAEHTTCEWSDKEIILHCDDDATYQLLTTPSQAAYLREAFSLPIRAMRQLAPDAQPATENSEPSTKQKRTANTLTFLERQALQTWMSQPATTEFVAHESDTDAARQATKDHRLLFPDLTITPANIASMRKILRIEKVKPEKPAPLQLPDGLTLADLQARLQAHEERLDDLRVAGQGMTAAIAELHSRLHTLIALHNDTAIPGCSIPPLAPLPTVN